MSGAASERTRPRRGERLELDIEKAVYRGLGLARHEGLVVLLPRAIPGERVRARVEALERGYARASVEAVLASSPARRSSPCPYVPACGGCSYQEIHYADQLAFKSAILREALTRAGVRWEGELGVAPSPEAGWRTRASLHLAQHGRWLLGLHEEASHRVVDLEACLQLSDGLNAVLRGLRAGLADPGSRAGRVSGVELAESFDGAQRVAAFIGDSPAPPPWLRRLSAFAPGLSGLAVSLPRRRGGHALHTLEGDPHVVSHVGGLALRAHVQSFFQGNRFLTPALLDAVLRLVPPGGPVLDLYAGVGLFALPLARRGDAFRAAELSQAAVIDAQFNARAAGLDAGRIERLDVGAALASWPVEPGERIVLDPPRTGAGRDVVRAVAARRPEVVVYVSCDPPTLGRDLRALDEAGYRLESVEALDLFPDTFHLETVVRLVPA